MSGAPVVTGCAVPVRTDRDRAGSEGGWQIRRATLEDLPGLLRCGEGFLQEAAGAYAAPIDPTVLERIVPALLAHPEKTCVFVAERDRTIVGFLLGTVGVLWFAPQVRVAKEEAWYVQADARGGSAALRLLRAFEAWATGQGIRHAAMSAIDPLHGGTVGKFLGRQGYALTEHVYLKEV